MLVYDCSACSLSGSGAGCVYRIAVCTYVRTRNSEPRLVALVAAQEERDDYGEQVLPLPLHLSTNASKSC